MRNTRCVLEKLISTSGKPPAPVPGWPGGWPFACYQHPQESRSPPLSSHLSQMPPTAFGVMVQGVSKEEEEEEEGRAPHGSCLPKPGAADFNLFPPLNEAQNVRMMFFSPNFSEAGHLKLSVKLRFQHMRNNLAALYTHILRSTPTARDVSAQWLCVLLLQAPQRGLSRGRLFSFRSSEFRLCL